jgi:hypothetical protein
MDGSGAAGGQTASGRRGLAISAAAILHVALGLGFGIGADATMVYLDRNGELPMAPFGFRSLAGPFEQLSDRQFSVLGWGLVVVCGLDVVAGTWMWQGRRRGARLGLVTSPIAFLLAIGFALPFMLIGVPLRMGLLLAGRRTLR